MTLRLKLIGMTAGMVLFLALINFVQFGRVLEKQKKLAVNTTQSYAAALARSIGSRFFERYQSIQALSHHESFADAKSDANVTSVLDSFAKLYGVYDVVLLTDAKGNYVASNTRGGDGKRLNTQALRNQNYAGTEWFRNVSSGQLSEDSRKNYSGTYFEDVEVDSIASMAYGEDRVGTGFSTAIKNSKGDTVGVLTARANITWIVKEFELFHTYLTERGLTSAEMELIGKHGVVLAGFDATSGGNAFAAANRNALKTNLADDKYQPAMDLVAGHSGSLVATHPSSQKEQAVGYVSTRNLPQFLESMGWGVMVRLDEGQTYAAVNEARNQFIWVSTVIMCLFAILAYWFAMAVGAQLARLSENISQTSAQVMAGSEQMSSASQSLASTATEAASSLEETVSSIEQLTAMVKRDAEHAMEAANLSRASRESADEGETEIKKLAEAMNQINESSKKIEDIINVIEDIAFQTNLLALNAAVEAARAGDQGRGFAVVAEEVRNLAQRSAAAAKDITSLIKENVTKIESGVQIAGHGGQALRNIVSSVRKVADLNSEIASASKEQSHGLEQINQAMAQLDQVTQTNAASAEEVASSAEEMSSQGLMMQETVSRLNTLIHGIRTARILAEQTAAKSHFGGFHGGGSGGSGGSGGGNPNVIPMRTKPNAEKVIPFDSDGDKGNLGSTSGF